jgi:hypothetical protein
VRIVDPRPRPSLVPEGSRAVVIAEHQEEFQDLPSVRTPGGQVITRWRLTSDEITALICGEDLFVTILSPGPLQPLMLSVGQKDWNATEPT